MKDVIDKHFELEKTVHNLFGYEENWKVIPLDDARDYYWSLDAVYDQEGNVVDGQVEFADTVEELTDCTGNYYINEIYTQRFLTKYVYRTVHYTMICVDTRTDGNKFLQIFDNTKEV